MEDDLCAYLEQVDNNVAVIAACEKIIRKVNYLYFYLKFRVLDIYYFMFSEEIVKKNSTSSINYEKLQIDRFIAHAGGMIDDHVYTNSIEALNLNYKKGFRFFELDIYKTRDGIYVAVHDWSTWKKVSGYPGDLPPSVKDFKKYKRYGKYEAIDIGDINKWFVEHEDAVLVTDKVNKPLEFSNIFIDNDRLIMEMFTWNAVYEGLKYDIKVMPAWHLLSTLGNHKVKKLLDLKISAVTANRKVVLKNKELLEDLLNHNIKIYAFGMTQNHDEKYIICNELNYFYGVYADRWEFKKPIYCLNRLNNVIK